MTPREAIEHINKIAFMVENEIEEIKSSKLLMALRTAISALEKQIPKKPTLDTIFPSGTKWWICPACKCDEIETSDNFCHECGQALDWSDTE